MQYSTWLLSSVSLIDDSSEVEGQGRVSGFSSSIFSVANPGMFSTWFGSQFVITDFMN